MQGTSTPQRPLRVQMAHLIFGDQTRPLGLGVLSIGSGVEATWRIREPDLLRLHALHERRLAAAGLRRAAGLLERNTAR